MKKRRFGALLVAGAFVFAFAGTALATNVDWATVTGYAVGSSDNNQADEWCKNGTKTEEPGGSTFLLTHDYAMVIVKAGSDVSTDGHANTIFDNPTAGQTVWADSNGSGAYDDGDKTISHIIFCKGETTTTTTSSTTTDETTTDETTTDETTTDETTTDQTTSTDETTTDETTTDQTTSTDETTSETTTSETTTDETTTDETTTSSETTSSETTSSETTSEETTSSETTKAKATPPSTDTITTTGGSSGGISPLLLLVFAGVLGGALLVVPSRARTKR